MAGVNKVIIVGHLGRDPEVKTFANGGKVVNLRLATSETWKDKQSGEKKERTEWHSVAIFNEALGGIAEKYLKKGSLCYIEGQLETRKWQDQAGADKYTTEIVLRPFNGTLTLLGGSGGGARDSGSTQSDGVDRAANGTARYDDQGGSLGAGRSDIDDEIPF